jgi:6-phosphogluconate dehydrogenase
MKQADIGLIGLAVMGQNLVLNMEDHGYTVAVFNRTYARTEEFMNTTGKGRNIVPAQTLEAFLLSLAKPRRIMLMVQAGQAVDAMIDTLLPHLDRGDILIDGGNSHYPDTIARTKRLEGLGIRYLGVGVSGGEEGARFGPSIMPGGDRESYELVAPIFTAISAKVQGNVPCCDYIGPDGAGHFVKMTHNGIEYADMQLIAETYALLKQLGGFTVAEMKDIFAGWNRGALESYLIEITADILSKTDEVTGKPMVDVILDAAGQKGTGIWTSKAALELGVPAPTIAEAVFARAISAQKDQRVVASKALSGPVPKPVADRGSLVDDLEMALYAAKICAYAQGFDLLKTASEAYGWDLKLGRISLLWRGGCIIRAAFLEKINDAFEADKGLLNLMLDPYFKERMQSAQQGWRRIVALAAQNGISAQCLTSALAYFDAYRTEVLPANLLQAQRDYFGAHTYRRVDREGVFHTQWT